MSRSKSISFLGAALAVALSAAVLAACGGGNNANPAVKPKTAAGNAATFGVANNSNLGKVLVNSQAHTVYLFQKDKGTKSSCTGACASAWPPVRASGKPAAGTGLTASKVGTTTRSDGKPQVTYNGHPLYTYTADQKAGQTNGQGLNAFGAKWFALNPAGAVVTATGSNGGGSASGY